MKTVLFALALVLAPPPQILATAFADEAVMLRSDIRVEADVVTLGDLFGITGAAADVVIARAPEPGRRTSLDPDYVRQQARNNGLAWANANQLRRVTIERASRMIDTGLLSEMIAAELNMRDGNEYEVQLSGAGALRDTVHVPPMSMVDVALDAGEAARWMLHCHHMPHLATGMMTEFAVTASV